ncbi:hypothetical protein ACSBR1_039789 [Camellia fascicularis]
MLLNEKQVSNFQNSTRISSYLVGGAAKENSGLAFVGVISRVIYRGSPENTRYRQDEFCAVVKETDCFFHTILKHTRRNRRPKPKQKQHGGGSGVEFVDYLLEKLLLLRRNQPELNNLGHYNQIASPDLG